VDKLTAGKLAAETGGRSGRCTLPVPLRYRFHAQRRLRPRLGWRRPDARLGKSKLMPSNLEPWGKTVVVEFEEGIAWVAFNRPHKRNALNPELILEMKATVEALAIDPRCGVLVLSGVGDSFTAGMDLKEYFRETDDAPDTLLINLRRINEEWQWRRLRDYPKPTIAMVNGWCFGAGFTPLVACDLAIAAEEATFGLSEINWGILPAGNVAKSAVEALGYRDAMYYSMTGEPFDAHKARSMGLVNEVVPRAGLQARTRALARVLLEKNQTVLRGTKIAMKRCRTLDWDTSADYLYAKVAEALYLGGADNRRAAMKGFLDEKKYRPGLENFKSTAADHVSAPGATHEAPHNAKPNE
jgi:feruloyl-CoA hydratase/lyase